MSAVVGDLDLTALSGTAGRIPERIKNCAYDVSGRVWVPKSMVSQVPGARKRTLLYGYLYQVEKAKSGQAVCKRCGEKIAKADIRIGFAGKDQRGEFGAIVMWLHLPCARPCDPLVRLARSGQEALKKKVLGFGAFSNEERAQLAEDLLKPDEEKQEEPPKLQEKRALPQHPKPKELRVDMLPFQAEGLGWMLARESDHATRGGILADEMGMGKTLQMISVILAGASSGPTLVVCPAAAMLQWRNEILRFTEPDSLPVELYYGGDRRTADFADKTRMVVLTTYQTLEADFRREVDKGKVKCQWCGRMFLPEKIGFHQKYYCGPDAERTEKQQKTELKGEAVKHMKIGGKETEIVLNPLNSIRKAASAALVMRRQRRKATSSAPPPPPQDSEARPETSPKVPAAALAVPFPPSVLPREAQEALLAGHRQQAASARGQEGRASTPQSRKRKLTSVEAPPEGEAAGGAASAPLSTGSSKTAWQTDALATPMLDRRWSRAAVKSEALASSGDAAVSRLNKSPAEGQLRRSSSAWSNSLRPSSAEQVIALDELSEDSDIELCGEIGKGGIDFVRIAFAASGKKSNSCANDAPADSLLPPRPDSEDEDYQMYKVDLSSSPLFRETWERVVLDEAHRIKGRINSTAQAAFALRAKTRWCLSGTPLQNRVGELYSLCRFVRFYPYAHYFCSKKGCQCTSLHYAFDPETSCCRQCGHTKMQHRSHFAQTISNPIKKFGFLGAGKVAMEKLRSEVLDRILLRRTKAERHADIQLPPLTTRIRKDALSPEERDFYTSMYMQSRTMFDTYVDKNTLLHNYAHVFDLIMRLRQAVDHPYLIVHGSLKSNEAGPMPTKSRGDADVCALCQDDIVEASTRRVAQCGHAFHRECVTEYLDTAPQLPSGGIGCPACYVPLTLSLEEDGEAGDEEMPEASASSSIAPRRNSRSIMQHIKSSEFKTSTKIEALLQEITNMISKDSASKGLVFSQFVNMLELIEWRLKREGISCAKLLGTMPITARNNIIISFMADPSLKILLISLKAGGEGLNLQAADHIFLMDPWWNPASELQAIQRAHRIGQKRPVNAVRFVATDTIEEKIIELQQKKQSVFDCTVGSCNQALQRLTAEDIRFLFNQ